MEKPLNNKEQQELEAEQKKPIIQEKHIFRQTKEKRLEEHFSDVKEAVSRNSAILMALNDGYTQGEVRSVHSYDL